MEKSFWNAAITRISAAKKTTAKAATPARRAVSVRRTELVFLRNRASAPARNEYPLSTSASRRVKLPMIDMGEGPHYPFRNLRPRQPESGQQGHRGTKMPLAELRNQWIGVTRSGSALCRCEFRVPP